jgi:hypothetical protein
MQGAMLKDLTRGKNTPPISVECLLSAVPREGWGGKAGTTNGEGKGRGKKGYSTKRTVAWDF